MAARKCLADFDYDAARTSADLLEMLSGYGEKGLGIWTETACASSDLLLFLSVLAPAAIESAVSPHSHASPRPQHLKDVGHGHCAVAVEVLGAIGSHGAVPHARA